jgi:hypothetical protein
MTYTLYGPDTQQLYTEAPKLERIISRLPGLQEVSPAICKSRPRASTSFSIATGRRPWV